MLPQEFEPIEAEEVQGSEQDVQPYILNIVYGRNIVVQP